jgi:hypothetical protein
VSDVDLQALGNGIAAVLAISVTLFLVFLMGSVAYYLYLHIKK